MGYQFAIKPYACRSGHAGHDIGFYKNILQLFCYLFCITQTEAPLLIRPMIGFMTNSEIHAVMVGGFATIAGSVLATYILLGVSKSNQIIL